MNPNYLSSRWHNHTEKVYFKLKQCFVCTSLVLLSTKEKRHEYKNQSNKNPLSEQVQKSGVGNRFIYLFSILLTLVNESANSY